MAARKDLPPPPPARPHPEFVGVTIMPIGGGAEVLIDDQDFAVFGEVRWSTQKSTRSRMRYAQRHETRNGVTKTFYLHRLIGERMGLPMPAHIDHRNRDGLDCRRQNLRSATKSQNVANMEKRRTGHAGYIGVARHGRKWRASIAGSLLGSFSDPASAARAYDAEARQRYGEFAATNFPPEASHGS